MIDIQLSDMNFSYAVLGACIILFIAYYIGRLFDTNFRCKTMRKWLKKNYIVFNILGKDDKTILSKVVNSENDIVIINNNMWIVDKGKIYRSNKEEIMGHNNLTKDNSTIKNIGDIKNIPNIIRNKLFIGKDNIIWEEGAPTVYVDMESFTLRKFEGSESPVKSEEVGSVILGFYFNQLAKSLATINRMQLLQMIICIGAIGSLILSFLCFDKLNTLEKTLIPQVVNNAQTNQNTIKAEGNIYGRDTNIWASVQA